MEEDKIVGVIPVKDYAHWAYKETNPDEIYKKPEALDDMVVIDISYGNFAGLFCSSILAEMGAEVIRIEPPEGDIARKMTPYGIMIKDTGLAYIVEGRNKYHITLNIESEEGREIFKRLVKKADVLIETYKPGYMDSLNIGYRDLSKENPGLIYAAIYTYGQFGHECMKNANKPDYDITDQARGVIMSITGEPELDPEVPKEYKKPLKHGNWMGWYAGGAWAALGILIAMFYKRKTGKGQFIDASPPEGLMAMSNYVIQFFHETGTKMIRAGNFDYAVFPYTYVKAKDGYVFMSGFTDPNWEGVTNIMNRPDLRERFPTIKDRLTPENQPIIQHEIEKFTQNYTSDELLKMCNEYNADKTKPGTVVTGRLDSPKEVLEREHWKLRKTFVKLNDPYYGELLIQNSSFKSMSRTPGRIKWACRPVGADNSLIYLKYLGFGNKKLEELKEKGVI